MGIVTYVWQNRCHDRHETMSMLRLLYNGNLGTNYLTFEGGDGGGGGEDWPVQKSFSTL